MSVFKRKYMTGDGKQKVAKNHSVEFRDHEGMTRRVTGFSDKSASFEMERQIKRLVALRMAGAGPDAELTHFLASCPAGVLEQLAD